MTNDHSAQAALLSDAELDDAADRLWEAFRHNNLVWNVADDTPEDPYPAQRRCDQDVVRSAVVDVLKHTVPAILRARANRIDADPKHIGVDLWPLEDLADELEAMGGGA